MTAWNLNLDVVDETKRCNCIEGIGRGRPYWTKKLEAVWQYDEGVPAEIGWREMWIGRDQ